MLYIGKTLFIPIRGDKRAIDRSCECPFCKANPDKQPQWDTISLDPKNGRYGIVHFPELQG